jgi:site-specific DNA-methyltransferase (adenine-specific)
MWVYGSGFPKSMDVSKAIDKAMRAEREVVGVSTRGSGASLVKLQNHRKGDTGIGIMDGSGKVFNVTAPATPEAAAWNGWGTALKPACEPIVIARKPLEGTVAANVLKYGTGAINIDGCRVPTFSDGPGSTPKSSVSGRRNSMAGSMDMVEYDTSKGRFPANLIHDGSEEVLALFPDTGKSTGGRTIKRKGGGNVGSGKASEASWTNDDPGFGDSGSAARFFYCAKASRSERGEGNIHPTVKPLALMRYLVRLVTRKGGIVLDPFMGSGTTGVAAIQEGMNFIGIEKDQHYYEIAQRRISQAKREPEGPIQLDLFAQTEGEPLCS